MREMQPARPGEDEVASLTWRGDDEISAGARVEATDGPLGVVRDRRTGGPEQAYLGVETDDGLIFMPERLIRETTSSRVFLSLPVADVKAQSSRDVPT